MAGFRYSQVASSDVELNEMHDSLGQNIDLESQHAVNKERVSDTLDGADDQESKESRKPRSPRSKLPPFVKMHDIRGRAYIKQLRWSTVIAFVVVLFVLATASVFSLFYWSWWPHHRKPALSLEELRNGTYMASIRNIDWAPTGEDGVYIEGSPDGFILRKWFDYSRNVKFIAPNTIRSEEGNIAVTRAVPNKPLTHALLTTQATKHWRHSTYACYWIIEIPKSDEETFAEQSSKLSSAAKPLHDGKISIASWSPDGSSIAYVYDHNVYLYHLGSQDTEQITFDGGADVYNGIPDWVYEEEVFAGDSAMWWSPSGKNLAYMRTNDTLVPKFPIPYFLSKAHDSDAYRGDKYSPAGRDDPGEYPSVVELKYPKPGFPNPQVELWIYSVDRGTANPVSIHTKLNEPILFELIWVGEQVVVKLMDRESDHMEVWVHNPKTNAVVRSRSYDSSDLGGAWFEITHNSHPLGQGYVDRIDIDGFNHLAYYSPANATEPVVLTSGKWEVLDSPMAVQESSGLVFFHATKRSSMESAIYYVSINHPERGAQLHPFQKEPGVYNAQFSPGGSTASVIYQGPHTSPKQSVWLLVNEEDSKSGISSVLSENCKLQELLDSRKLSDDSLVQYGTLDIGDGISVNYREIRPVKFNPRKKHPVLFFNYGGPGSQMVRRSLSMDFQRVFAETHNAVVVTVDPRGTGGRGRKFMSEVRNHLGECEADDVIAVAKHFNEKSYIDEETTAIWGWSYGGFLTLKALERDTDLAFKYGVAVAPVTDWSLYDSIYTERYMHTPDHNADGYAVSKISNVTNLARHKRFLIMHGTGDDNVHFQNTLKLLDELDLAGVENYDVHVFPDSDHSISFHNANMMVYDRVDQWLANQQTRRKRLLR